MIKKVNESEEAQYFDEQEAAYFATATKNAREVLEPKKVYKKVPVTFKLKAKPKEDGLARCLCLEFKIGDTSCIWYENLPKAPFKDAPKEDKETYVSNLRYCNIFLTSLWQQNKGILGSYTKFLDDYKAANPSTTFFESVDAILKQLNGLKYSFCKVQDTYRPEYNNKPNWKLVVDPEDLKKEC